MAGFSLDPGLVGLVELLAIFAFIVFVLAGPGAIAATLVLITRRHTRRLGLLMLASGVVGYICVASALALRIRIYPLFPSHGGPVPADWIITSLLDGLAGFTAFVVFAVMFYFRSPMGLTKRSSEPPTAEKIPT